VAVILQKISLLTLFGKVIRVCKDWHNIITGIPLFPSLFHIFCYYYFLNFIIDKHFLIECVTKQVLKKATINKDLYTAAKLQEMGPCQFWKYYLARDGEREVLEGNLQLVAMYMGKKKGERKFKNYQSFRVKWLLYKRNGLSQIIFHKRFICKV
jgi:hypothetical protein